jgi:hypothetical protein
MQDPKQDPDPEPTKKWDPDPEKLIPDPQHWILIVKNNSEPGHRKPSCIC